VTNSHREVIESTIGFPGAGATKESEVEEIEKTGAIGALRDPRVEKIGQREIRELTPTNQIGAARGSRKKLTNRRRQARFRAVKPVIVLVSDPTACVPPDPPPE